METTLAIVLTTVVTVTTAGTISMALLIQAAYNRMDKMRKRTPVRIQSQYKQQ